MRKTEFYACTVHCVYAFWQGLVGRLYSATVRLHRTSDGKLLVGLNWSNGWGGQEGSVCDRTMRKNLTQAATEISQKLIKAMPCHPR